MPLFMPWRQLPAPQHIVSSRSWDAVRRRRTGGCAAAGRGAVRAARRAAGRGELQLHVRPAASPGGAAGWTVAGHGGGSCCACGASWERGGVKQQQHVWCNEACGAAGHQSWAAVASKLQPVNNFTGVFRQDIESTVSRRCLLRPSSGCVPLQLTLRAFGRQHQPGTELHPHVRGIQQQLHAIQTLLLSCSTPAGYCTRQMAGRKVTGGTGIADAGVKCKSVTARSKTIQRAESMC